MSEIFVDENGKLGIEAEVKVALGLSLLTLAVARNNYAHGWREPGQEPKRPIGDLIALLHSEVTEAFEAYRNNEPTLWYEHKVRTNGEEYISEQDDGFADQPALTHMDGETVLGKPQGIASELADVIIRVLDMAEEHEIPLTSAILDKHAYNLTRPFRHGGKVV